MNTSILHALFETDALRLCPEGQPFWYTSGKLGPFYINTHFLYGSEAAANDLLTKIEAAADTDRSRFFEDIAGLVMAQYEANALYRGVIDALVGQTKALPFDLISGGERRDFFFSIPVAKLLDKPHLSIFKDGDTVLGNSEKALQTGQTALHIADLVTEASSYTRAWIPALLGLGLTLRDTLCVVDRDQGGEAVLKAEGVQLHSLIRVDGEFLQAARKHGRLTETQEALVRSFLETPERFTPDFLAAHPDFLPSQIAMGGKAEERARLCIEKGFDKQ